MRVQIIDGKSNQRSSSTWKKITDGVPQGSVLGPLLFLIYVNDLPKTINDNNIDILFADDTSGIVKSHTPKDFQTNMVEEFDNANKWFKVNSLSINVKKSHYIPFKTKNKPTLDINIVCDNKSITPATDIKYLGIYLQDSINWSCHIEYITPKLSSACYVMKSIRRICQ